MLLARACNAAPRAVLLRAVAPCAPRLARSATSSATREPVKLTTGLVGLDVVPDARAVLLKLYSKTLADVTVLPAGTAYRAAVEELTRARLAAVEANLEVSAIERAVGAGQVEELIEEAKGELALIPEYASWRYWEAPPARADDDEHSMIYDELEAVDPESVEHLGLRGLAEAARAKAAAARAGAAAPPRAA